jgi:hypothetical protein
MRHPPHRLLAGLLVAIAAGTAAQVSQAAVVPPPVPPEIAVEAGHAPYLVGHAVGVQIYTCTATGAGGHAWSGPAPRATLHDDRGHVIATHFAGPSWRAKDSSTVVASRVRGVTVDETAVQWLLLKRESALPGPDGDRLTHTTFIQRIATVGGLPPASADCTAGTAGIAREIPYTADYVFW